LLLVAGLAGRRGALFLVPAVSVVHLLHFWARSRSLAAFSVQVRLAYTGLTLAAQVDVTQGLFLALTTGTLALVLFGYCPLARMLSLMPWNRQAPLSWALVQRTVMTAPTRGSFLEEATHHVPASRT
jgi:hypothetical protein